MHVYHSMHFFLIVQLTLVTETTIEIYNYTDNVLGVPPQELEQLCSSENDCDFPKASMDLDHDIWKKNKQAYT